MDKARCDLSTSVASFHDGGVGEVDSLAADRDARELLGREWLSSWRGVRVAERVEFSTSRYTGTKPEATAKHVFLALGQSMSRPFCCGVESGSAQVVCLLSTCGVQRGCIMCRPCIRACNVQDAVHLALFADRLLRHGDVLHSLSALALILDSLLDKVGRAGG